MERAGDLEQAGVSIPRHGGLGVHSGSGVAVDGGVRDLHAALHLRRRGNALDV
jgi:hypothetical protein